MPRLTPLWGTLSNMVENSRSANVSPVLSEANAQLDEKITRLAQTYQVLHAQGIDAQTCRVSLIRMLLTSTDSRETLAFLVMAAVARLAGTEGSS